MRGKGPMIPRWRNSSRVTRSAVAALAIGGAIPMICCSLGRSTELNPGKETPNVDAKLGRTTTTVVHPVSLRVTYRDEKVIPEQQGEMHIGSAAYVFKNQLPIPIRIVFPPIGYTAGTATPITPYCVNPQSMPTFCRTAQIVELAAFSERRFTSRYNTLIARGVAPPTERFVFGPASNNGQENVLVDAVESVGEFKKTETTKENGDAH